MVGRGLLGLLLATIAFGVASAAPHHDRHASRHHHSRHAARPYDGYGYGRPYVIPASPTPTCRYPDGTPYDPDIIGGANHVGDGGPAGNLGGFNPCGY